MKYSLVQFIFMAVILSSFSQTEKLIRYKDPVFDKVDLMKNISYVQSNQTSKDEFYLFDFYQPMADSLTKNRPLIIWMHGGGFKFGSKNSNEISIWGNAFAKRGYAFAAINYRLSKKNTLTNLKDLIAACADATENTKQAIQFFKTNYSRFRIDTNRIILGGNSAGGIIALQTVYSNPTELAKLSEIKNETVDTSNDNNYTIAAIINFWGALFDTAWLKNAEVPIVSVHGRKDKTVPIDHQGSSFFGSLNIHEKADSLHIPNDIKIYEDYAHELKKHFNPFLTGSKTKKRWGEAAGFAAGFLYSTLRLQD